MIGCGKSSQTELYQYDRDNVFDVHGSVKYIFIDDLMIGSNSRLYVMNDYLLVCDYKSLDKHVHLFDITSFDYLASTAQRGQGPGEIANIGRIGINNKDRLFFVNDHGKQRIFGYKVDSVFLNPSYQPEEVMGMDETLFPDKYQYINDTLCIGLTIQPIGSADFKPIVAKWNMHTGAIEPMKYEHSGVDKKRITFAASETYELYVECYNYYDLISICDFNGNLMCNIYGRRWDAENKKRILYYKSVSFCGDKIFVTYLGKEDVSVDDETRRIQSNYPTKFMVFGLNGDYIKTLETGYRIVDFCYDKANNRIVMFLDEEIQLAYLKLDGIVD